MVAFGVSQTLFFLQIAAGLAIMSVSLQIAAVETTDTGAATDSVLGKMFSDRYADLATFFGGVLTLLFCVWIAVAATWNYLKGTVPDARVMAAVGIAALLSNGFILVLLRRDHESGENMRSAWRSARNDVIGNGPVIAAAAGVYVTGESWPDMVAAGLILPFTLRQAIIAMRSLSANKPCGRTIPKSLQGESS